MDNNGHFCLYGGFNFVSGNLNDKRKFNGTYLAFQRGSTTIPAAPLCGLQKTFSYDYHPGSRTQIGVTVSPLGSVYIIGGESNSVCDKWSDIWKFENDNGWSYWDGNVLRKENLVSGTIKVPSTTNKLVGKYDAISEVDDFDNIWIFGGYGQTTNGNSGL